MYNDFNIKSSSIFSEVKIITPDVFKDNRGFLFTDYLDSFFKNEFTPSLNFVHSKNAHNNAKVLRGIHGDFDSYKLVECLYGEIYQVVVDCRENSPTFLQYDSFILNHLNPEMILMPPGFGNAFLVTSDYAVYNYKLAYDGIYNDHDKQFTYKWNDKKININWPIKDPILSNRDK